MTPDLCPSRKIRASHFTSRGWPGTAAAGFAVQHRRWAGIFHWAVEPSFPAGGLRSAASLEMLCAVSRKSSLSRSPGALAGTSLRGFMEVLFLHPAPGLEGKWVRVSPAVGEAGGERGAVKCPHATSVALETFRFGSRWSHPVGPRPATDELERVRAEEKSCPPSSSSSLRRFPVPSSPPRAGRGGRRVPPPAGLSPHLAGAGAGQRCRYEGAGGGETAATASPPRRGLVFPTRGCRIPERLRAGRDGQGRGGQPCALGRVPRSPAGRTAAAGPPAGCSLLSPEPCC